MIQLEVLYPSTRRPSPLKELHSVGASVPIGAKGKVYVGGRNDMDTPQQMGISWIIKDPDGIVPVNGEYSYWELWPHPSPGETHRFVGPTFNLDKVGTWRIGIGLYMNPDDPVQVDSYSGVLCDVVVAVPEAEFRDFGITSYDTVVAGEKIELAYGDTLKVNVSFDYRGPAGPATLYGAIGNSGFPGDELIDEGSFLKRLTGEQSIDLPQSLEFTPVTASVDIPITTEISPYTNYDLYVKFVEYRKEAGMPKVDNIIDIVGIPPEYELIQETIYPYAYVYDGKSELTTATFRTDPFSSAAWQAEKLADKLKEELEKDGRRVLVLKAYADTTPLFWTDLRFEIETTLPPETATGGIVVGIDPVTLGLILGIILATIGLVIAIMIAVVSIVRSFKHKPISEEIKATWSRETLISVIHDFENKLDRSLTPIAELEQMSDGALRDYTNAMAKEIVPPGVSWLPWAIAGGVGVVAVGTVAVLAAKKKK